MKEQDEGDGNCDMLRWSCIVDAYVPQVRRSAD